MAWSLTIFAFVVHVMLGCCAHHHHGTASQAVADEEQSSSAHSACSHSATHSSHEDGAHELSFVVAETGFPGHSHSDPGNGDPCHEAGCQYLRGAAPEVTSLPVSCLMTLSLPPASAGMDLTAGRPLEGSGFFSLCLSPRSRCAQLQRWLV